MFNQFGSLAAKKLPPNLSSTSHKEETRFALGHPDLDLLTVCLVASKEMLCLCPDVN